ncbi:MAG: M48 family metallopeptidase [Methanosphaera sp.]|nr:M48 family metallopeptidase [Methanosphaera sp.]
MNTIKIKDKTILYSIKYSNVKYIRYEIRSGELKLVLPRNYTKNIEDCIHKKDKWIYGKITKYEKSQKRAQEFKKQHKIYDRSIPELRDVALKYIEVYEKELDVSINRLYIRKTKHKWGSCSSLGNITLSESLRFLPDELIEFVVYHELSHLLVMAHNDEFYSIIRRRYPDYEKYDKLLDDYGLIAF